MWRAEPGVLLHPHVHTIELQIYIPRMYSGQKRNRESAAGRARKEGMRKEILASLDLVDGLEKAMIMEYYDQGQGAKMTFKVFWPLPLPSSLSSTVSLFIPPDHS